jgi:hypothetical protein
LRFKQLRQLQNRRKVAYFAPKKLMDIKQRIEKLEQSLTSADIKRVLIARDHYRDEIKTGRTLNDIQADIIETYKIPPESLSLITGNLHGKIREIEEERIKKWGDIVNSPERLKKFALGFVEKMTTTGKLSRQEAIETILRRTPVPREVFDYE